MKHSLKRLELNGFKSFAGKTVLEFPAGITAIVGPNGSGKSNVIDAIRWLLGERDAKNLRGGKGEDLIFAGTPKRPRLGQAQASLHFEDLKLHKPEEGLEDARALLDRDVSEISVSREVRRDGVNRYFLNSSEVRLKDIVDFFAQAKLGSKGLTVVTQGNSDIFIRVSPLERRAMIEEILGLREFQIKKHDAERRLKNSQINLEKVKALLEEILPHLRSLKRQTSRWEKRGELSEELRNLEDQFFGAKAQELEKGIAKVEHEVKSHSGELQRLEKEKQEKEAKLKALEASQPEERKELTEIKKDIQALLEERSEIQKNLGRLEAQIEILKSRAEVPSSVSAEKLFDLAKRVKKLLEDALTGDPESNIKQALNEINSVLVKSDKKEEGDDSIEEEFKLISKNLGAIQKNLEELKEKEKALEKGQEEFYEEFKKAVNAVNEIKSQIEVWQDKNRERILEKERLVMKQEELEHQIRQVGRDIKEFLNVHVRAEEDADSMERRILRLRGELASMGEVDELVMKEAKETEERHEFLSRELGDLEKAKRDLEKLIEDLNIEIKTEFDKAFIKINEEFQKFFELMFGGGNAKMVVMKKQPILPKAQGEEVEAEQTLPEEEEEKEEGVEVKLSLPRKRINSLEMLSGGEKSLVGIAALFALISVSPPPFLVLDEIDAPLDDRNARRFAEMLKEFSKKTQFIVVTHNRATMEAANVLYGVTLNDDGTSKILSMKLEQ